MNANPDRHGPLQAGQIPSSVPRGRSGAPRRSHVAIVAVCLAIVLPGTGAALRADEQVLVLTAEEFDANLNFRERSVEILPQAADPEGPRIVVVKPDIGSDVATPVDVAVQFEPAGDAEIDMGSLRIRYGWFDITQRVLDSMEVSGNGISGKITSMRNGKHTLKVSISDTLDRESKASIVFHVVGT